MNISGGRVEGPFTASAGSVVNITGGIIDGGEEGIGAPHNIPRIGFQAHFGSEVNISGGQIKGLFAANSGSEVNLIGTEFFLDGIAMDELIAGVPFAIAQRDVVLSGFLADGTEFSFIVSDDIQVSQFSFFDSGATLTVTLVPEPSSTVLVGMVLLGLGLSTRPLKRALADSHLA